jgi:hypothetical protein
VDAVCTTNFTSRSALILALRFFLRKERRDCGVRADCIGLFGFVLGATKGTEMFEVDVEMRRDVDEEEFSEFDRLLITWRPFFFPDPTALGATAAAFAS